MQGLRTGGVKALPSIAPLILGEKSSMVLNLGEKPWLISSAMDLSREQEDGTESGGSSVE